MAHREPAVISIISFIPAGFVNEEQIMHNIHSIFWNMIREYGFQKKSKTKYYMRKEDIVVFFSIDCPSGLYYFEFAIIPLYFPTLGEGIDLTFGNRLENMHISLKETIKDNSSEEEIANWCAKAKWYMETYLIPFIEKVSSASGIREYLLHKDEYDTTVPLRCPQNHVYELLVYTEVFLHHISEAYAAAELFYQWLPRYPYMPSVMEWHRNSVKQILDIAGDSEALQATFTQWRTEKMLLFQ